MSYKITFKDHTSVIVTNEVGDKLKASLLAEDKPENFTLAGDVYRLNQVVSVTRSNLQAKDAPIPSQQLSAPTYHCVQAGTSIQLAIHKVIKQQFASDWPKRVGDKKLRERIRKEIRAKFPERKWCDHHVSEHACLSYRPTGAEPEVSKLL